ncbi:amidohydrolase [Bacillus sp. 165]|nr:amidohydrolase [Bacillus sp. 165]
MVEMRRYLHQYPELSFQEYKTAQYIASFYEERGIEVQMHVGGNGVVAKVHGKSPGKTVALRADFDALPIQDEKTVPYRSKVNGVMHACGHDGHTATLLILAEVLHELRHEFDGTVVFIHQHAEELAPGGAKPMIEAGCLETVDVIFGTHLWATEPLGSILIHPESIMAAADRFEIVIKGKGGHGAQPHETKDSILAASHLVLNLQQIVSRRINPLDSAVLSIGSFEAVNAFNVIAEQAKLVGTVRTFKENIQNFMQEEIERIIQGTCLAFGVEYEFTYFKGYPPVINHKDQTTFLADLAKDIPGVLKVHETEPLMVGEDFAYYLQSVPGTFFLTGAQAPHNKNPYPHHHARFDFDERAMLIAANTLGNAALTYMSASPLLQKSNISDTSKI